MKKVLKFTLKLLLGLFVATYLGIQVYHIFFSGVKTEVALGYTMANQTSAQGVIVRDEEVISAANQGFYNYLVPDGSKVSSGQRLAEVYTSAEDLTQMSKLANLYEQRDVLTQASKVGVAGTDPEILSAEIVKVITQMNDNHKWGDYSKANFYKVSLMSQISHRLASVGSEVDFLSQIAQIDAEIAALTETKPAYTYETAAKSGYFSSGSDGLESALCTATLNDLTIDQIQQIVNHKSQDPPQQSFGRIVKSFQWYVASVVDESDLEWLKEGKEVNLEFIGTLNDAVKGQITRVSPVEKGKALIIIQCDNITDALVNMRVQNVEIRTSVYRGVRFPTSAMHIVNGEKGVFVKQGNTAKFKKIKPLAKDANFTLSQIFEGEDSQMYLGVYDEIIVSGKDLSDGKRIG